MYEAKAHYLQNKSFAQNAKLNSIYSTWANNAFMEMYMLHNRSNWSWSKPRICVHYHYWLWHAYFGMWMEFRINDERDKFFSILVPTRVFACSLAFFFSLFYMEIYKKAWRTPLAHWAQLFRKLHEKFKWVMGYYTIIMTKEIRIIPNFKIKQNETIFFKYLIKFCLVDIVLI